MFFPTVFVVCSVFVAPIIVDCGTWFRSCEFSSIVSVHRMPEHLANIVLAFREYGWRFCSRSMHCMIIMKTICSSSAQKGSWISRLVSLAQSADVLKTGLQESRTYYMTCRLCSAMPSFRGATTPRTWRASSEPSTAHDAVCARALVQARQLRCKPSAMEHAQFFKLPCPCNKQQPHAFLLSLMNE